MLYLTCDSLFYNLFTNLLLLNYFRNLVDDWLEHYRLAVGLKSPHMLNVRESPDFSSQARNIQSAKLADSGQAARLKHLGLETLVDYKKQRAPSAPLGKSNKDFRDFLYISTIFLSYT